MAHANQERYAAMVDAKLRATLVTKDSLIFNNRYEGTPTAGKVKIPVRDTEVVVSDYDKASGNIDHIFYRGAEAQEFITVNGHDYGVYFISDHYPVTCTFIL